MPAPLGLRSGRGVQQIIVSAAAPPVFNPATLPLSMWVKADYSAAPWLGNASAGASAGRNLVTNGSNPTAGAAVGGKIPAQFTSASSQNLVSTVNNNVLLSASAFSVFVLFNATTVPAPNASPYADGNFLTDLSSGETTFGITSSGITACVYDGGFPKVTVACSTGAWHLAQFKLQAGTLRARVDSGSWSTIACGALPFLTPGTVNAGTAYASASYFNGRIAEWATAASAISDADFDNIKAYVNATYGLSL